MTWRISTIGEALSVIKNGINCEQNKIPFGEKISRIETISKKEIDYERVGYANLSDSEKEKSKLQVGDILFSHINSPIHVGKSAIYGGEQDLYHGINLLLLRTIDDVDSHFFNYYLNHIFLEKYWEKNCKKAINQASVNQKDISKVPFKYPSLSVQNEIVARLDKIFTQIDDAISYLEAGINDLEALFQSYLSEVFNGNSNDRTVMSIDEMVVNTKNINPEKNPDLEFLYVDVSSVSNTDFIITNTQRLLGKDAPSRAKKHIVKNDIIFATVRPTLKRVAIVPEELNNQVASTGYVVLRAKEGFHYKFIFFFLLSKGFIKSMESLQRGASYPAVSDSDVKAQKLKVPSYQEQTLLVDKLEIIKESLGEIKTSYSQKINDLNSLKRAILKHAFNGKLIKE